MVFDGIEDKGKALFWITAHEIGHSWFPMIVGSNERRNAWMDEGFNTFIDVYESDDFNHGEFAPKHDHEFAPGGGNPVEDIQPVLKDPDAPIIMTRPDAIPEKYRHPVTYFKTALGLVLLREQILGPKRFDFAFRKYIRDWAYKHPSPSDFFRAMDSAAGEDLSWFWRGWFFDNWNGDLAVTKVTYEDGDPAKGANRDDRQSRPAGDAGLARGDVQRRHQDPHPPARRNLDPAPDRRAAGRQRPSPSPRSRSIPTRSSPIRTAATTR